MNKVKSVFEWIISIFVVIVFIISAFALIGAINGSRTGVSSVFGFVFNTVQSDSMEDELFEGDITIGRVYDGRKLEPGQVITFKQRVDDTMILNTHRIHSANELGNSYYYETKGDNVEEIDRGYRTSSDIVAVHSFRIPKVGLLIDWIRKPAGFIVCVILPIVAVIIYEAYKIIAVLLKAREEKLVVESVENTSEDIKAEIIRQYLASQEASSVASESPEARAEDTEASEKEQASDKDENTSAEEK